MNKSERIVVATTLVLVAIVVFLLWGTGMLSFSRPFPTTVTKSVVPVRVVTPAPVVTPVQVVTPAVVCSPCCCCPCPPCPKPAVKPAVKKKVEHKVIKVVIPPPPVVRTLPRQKVFVAPQLPPAIAIDQMCPNGWTLNANAWSLGTFPDELRQKTEGLIAAAGSRASYRGDDVSRTIGGALRKYVEARATVNADIRVLYRNPKTLAVVRDLGILRIVSGTGSFQFTDDPRQWIVEMIWPASFVSPTVSMGEHRLWIFPDEWARFCSPNVHGIVP